MYRSEDRRDTEVRQLAARLFTEKRGYLLAIARRNATGDADAEEALQDAFAAFITHFDPDGGAPPLAWLTLTLKRQCWRLRRQAHLDRQVGQEAGRGAEELGSRVEALPSLASGPEQRMLECVEARRQLAQLRPDERTAICQFAAGFSYKEIAAKNGWTYTKVNRCIAEGRETLR